MAVAPIEEQPDMRPADRSLETLFDNALPRIYGYILVRVGNKQSVAEELTQETMLAMAKAVAGPHPAIVDPIAWLFGTARYKVIDYYRSREHADRPLVDWSGESAELAGFDDDLERIVDRDELLAGLVRLPPGQRIALVLHYADGLSVAEIALAFGKSEHAMESLLARGRRSLRKYLTDQESTQ